MLNTIYENQFDPNELFKIKVDFKGKSVFEAGDADLTVNGRKLKLFDGDSITVDKDGNITSYTHNGITYTKDTISSSAEWHGLSLTAGANYVKVARAAMAAIVYEVIDNFAPSTPH